MKIYNKYKSYILYFFIYCPLGVVCPLISQYLNSIGFTGTQVGVVTAGGTLAAVLGGLIWGKIYANTQRKRLVIAIMFALAGISALISLAISTFTFYVLIYGALYFNQGPVHGLCDSMMIDNGKNFAAIRSMGAVGYAVAVFVGGQLAEVMGLKVIFYLHACFYVIAILIVMTETEPAHYTAVNAKRSEKAKISELFMQKKFVMLLVCAFFCLGEVMANNTYFSYLFIEAGGDISGVGLAFLLMAGSEAPFMWLIPKINRRIPTEKLIAVGMVVTALRYGFYATGPSVGWLLGTFFLQGIMDGFLLVEFVKYFGKIVEPRLSSLAVATYYSIGNSFPSIICNLLGGVIMDTGGIKSTFLLFSLMSVVSLIIYISMGLHKAELK